MHKLFTITLLLISFAKINSQVYNFQNLSVEDGLTQSEITDICEDRLGNLWFGTLGGGVVKYDGYSFVSFKEESGLVNNYIRALYTDQNGNIWIGTEAGISVYDGRQFVYLDQKGGPGNVVIRDIVQDHNKAIWIATNDSGLYRKNENGFTRYTKDSGLPHNTVNCLYSENNNLWMGTDNGVSMLSGKMFTNISRSDGLAHSVVRGICADNLGNIWFATYNGLTVFNGDSLTSYSVSDGLCSNRMYTAFKDRSGNLWFGSAKGIIRFNGSSFKCYTEAEGLAGNVVLCITQSNSLELWFGTSGGGVSKFDGERFIHYNQNDRLGRRVYSVVQAINGNMIFGTSRGGLTVFDGTRYSLIKDYQGFTSSDVMSLYYDQDSVLWIGTLNDGIYSYDKNGFIHYTRENGFRSNHITGFTEDIYGNIWVSSIDSGLFILTKYTSGIIQFNESNGLSSNNIYTITSDSEGNIWVGTTKKGVDKIFLDIKTQQATVTTYNDKNGLTNNAVRSILIDSMNRVYLGTAGGGICIYDRKRFTYLTTEHGLFSLNIYSLIFDDNDNLYVGTEGGVDRLMLSDSLKVLEYRHFGRNEGFMGIELYRNSCCKDNMGNLWFGTVNGVTCYDPDEDIPVKLAPKIHLTGLKLFFNDIQNTPYADSLDSWSSIPENIVLPYNQNNLTFEFMGIYLRNPDAVKYRWMLEGFNTEWSPLLKQREAIFSNLPPGEYTFKVVACNEFGICNDSPAEITFIIKPPFWQLWWLRIAAFIVLIVFIWFLVFLRIRRIRKRNTMEQEKLEMEKNIIELEQEAARLQMNPHFIFNSLNSIQGFIATNDAFQAKRYLAKFARLMRLILENAREEYIPIQNEVDILENYLELEKLSTNNKFEFEIHIDKSLNPDTCEIPPMMIQPFVENAIVHGIKGKDGEGHIHINFGKKDKTVVCEIIDDGIGRVESAQYKNTGKSKHKSSGISITKRRLEQLSVQTSTNAGIEIIDLTEKGKAKGTKVIVTIPFETD